MIEYNGDIRSISDAVDEIRRLKRDDFILHDPLRADKFPFGLWFRGHERCDLEPEPRVFRDERPAFPRRKGIWDETNIFEHLRLRVPGPPHAYETAFDWLCLMQHYSVPTRLLDWSESILPALYFATGGKKSRPGDLLVLHARRLNKHVRQRPTISTSEERSVVIRSAMAATRSASRLVLREEVRKVLTKEEDPPKSNWLDDFCAPIAVFPSRLHQRMVLQASVFTLHGGKHYPKELEPEYQGDDLPSPVSLQDIHDTCGKPGILRRFRIHNKKKIREDLLLLGIHEGTLFPEIDRQAVYLEDLWWYGGDQT